MRRFLYVILVLILCFASNIGQIAFASGIIDVSIEIPDDIVGNNFFKDNLPFFEINIKNLTSEALKCKYTGKVINADGKEVFSVSGSANIESGKVCVKSIEIPAVYYCVQVFKLDVNVDGLHFFE